VSRVGWAPASAGTDLSSAPLANGTRDAVDRTKSRLNIAGIVGAGGVPAAVYMFNASAGLITLNATGVPDLSLGGSLLPRTNIDLVVEVRDLTGSYSRIWDAPDFLNIPTDTPVIGGGTVLPADGMYYIVVKGTGKEGVYSSYASLGRFTLIMEYPTDVNGQFAEAFRCESDTCMAWAVAFAVHLSALHQALASACVE
jgi:hypothetical protein